MDPRSTADRLLVCAYKERGTTPREVRTRREVRARRKRIEWAKTERWLRKKGFEVLGGDTARKLPLLKRPKFQWDGSPRVISSDPSGLIHEYSHFVVVPRKRLRAPGFGLGMEPDYHSELPNARSARSEFELVSDSTAQREEKRASLLGILIERALGLGWVHTLQDHDWLCLDDFCWQEAPDCHFGWLQSALLVDHEGDVNLAALPSWEDRACGAFNPHAKPVSFKRSGL